MSMTQPKVLATASEDHDAAVSRKCLQVLAATGVVIAVTLLVFLGLYWYEVTAPLSSLKG